MLVVIIIILFISGLMLWSQWKLDKRFVVLGNTIPGPSGIPLVGNLFSVPHSGPAGLKYRRVLVKKYGHINRLWVGNMLAVCLSDAEDCEIVLKDTTHLTKSVIYNLLHSWLGTGLLTSSGEKWHKRRKAITPAFHFKILEEFIDIFNKNGNILIECLRNHCDGSTFNAQPLISRYALDVICETAMGTEINAQLHHNSNYVQAVTKMCELISERIRKPWLQNNFIYFLTGKHKQEQKLIKILHDQTNKVIKEKSHQMREDIHVGSFRDEEGVKRKVAFLELLLKMKMSGNSTFQSDNDIREEVDTFLFEEKIYEELVEVMDLQDSQKISYENLQLMKYLECVIKESLRLYPSVPLIGREIFEDLHLPSGYTVPAGTVLLISIYFLHRNEKYFPNPEEFNPDNFLPKNLSKRHPYAYVPFSAGPRNCIGQKFAMLELKSVLSKIIFNFIIDPSSDVWDVEEDPSLVFRCVGGHKIKLRPRK
ncbi:cytochrome P450 4C1-like isoform X2 [Rhodnius prolixus]|uniref:cytochrome P450 4C1-like isoform X2 n=1 Tax=Rhodnius prolixus TaxID=13249 RepID=UPI003D18BF03